MKIGILQPSYLPWLGYFEQIYQSDIFIIYDDVQYDKHGWRNRNRIKTAHGAQWLSVPVYISFDKHPVIHEVKINNSSNWRRKHLESIRQSYSKAPFFLKIFPFFEQAYSQEWDYLVDLDIHLIQKLIECLRMSHKKIVRSSDINIQGNRIERLIAICKAFNADIFYEGAAGKYYIRKEDFIAQGIQIEFQDYKHPVYRQLYGDFIPYLSVVDLIFNHGHESLAILANQKESE